MDVQTSGDVTIAVLPTRIDAVGAKDVEDRLTACFEAGARTVVADFAATEYVSSAGLRVFLAALKFLQKEQGRIVLCGLAPFVAEVFDVSGFSTLFEITESRDEALTLLA